MATHIGHLPDTFRLFLQELGVPAKQLTSTKNEVVKTMKAHTLKMFKTYWKCTRGPEKNQIEEQEQEETDDEEEVDNVTTQTSQENAYMWLAQEETDHFSTTDEDEETSSQDSFSSEHSDIHTPT